MDGSDRTRHGPRYQSRDFKGRLAVIRGTLVDALLSNVIEHHHHAPFLCLFVFGCGQEQVPTNPQLIGFTKETTSYGEKIFQIVHLLF
jgi:hypothetical protein